ncbi:uncharacterized protein LOC135442904 [Zonotrichia leucophrys gambelii]|uniref:uncharacterized protein LOC135442904 n=1 Tax=Zonotrichia leucophrys gambelii TaxID=257770 RepID=UPI00314034CD
MPAEDISATMLCLPLHVLATTANVGLHLHRSCQRHGEPEPEPQNSSQAHGCAVGGGPRTVHGGHGAGKPERTLLLDAHGSWMSTAPGSARLPAQLGSPGRRSAGRQGGRLPFPARATRWLRAGDPEPSEAPGPRRLGAPSPRFSFCHISQALAHRRVGRRTGTPLRAWERRRRPEVPGEGSGWGEAGERPAPGGHWRLPPCPRLPPESGRLVSTILTFPAHIRCFHFYVYFGRIKSANLTQKSENGLQTLLCNIFALDATSRNLVENEYATRN